MYEATLHAWHTITFILNMFCTQYNELCLCIPCMHLISCSDEYMRITCLLVINHTCLGFSGACSVAPRFTSRFAPIGQIEWSKIEDDALLLV